MKQLVMNRDARNKIIDEVSDTADHCADISVWEVVHSQVWDAVEDKTALVRWGTVWAGFR